MLGSIKAVKSNDYKGSKNYPILLSKSFGTIKGFILRGLVSEIWDELNFKLLVQRVFFLGASVLFVLFIIQKFIFPTHNGTLDFEYSVLDSFGLLVAMFCYGITYLHNRKFGYRLANFAIFLLGMSFLIYLQLFQSLSYEWIMEYSSYLLLLAITAETKFDLSVKVTVNYISMILISIYHPGNIPLQEKLIAITFSVIAIIVPFMVATTYLKSSTQKLLSSIKTIKDTTKVFAEMEAKNESTIGSRLHDKFAQQVRLVQRQARKLAEEKPDNQEFKDLLDNINILSKITENLQTLLRSNLESQGFQNLYQAVKALITGLNDAADGVQFLVFMQSQIRAKSWNNVEYVAYQIIKHSILNIIFWSQAKEADINIFEINGSTQLEILKQLETVGDVKKTTFENSHLNPSHLIVEIIDNGIGFKVAANFFGHWGLLDMKGWVESLGGELIIKSELNVGTAIIAIFPLTI